MTLRLASLLLFLMPSAILAAKTPLIQVDVVLFLHQSELLSADQNISNAAYSGIPLDSSAQQTYHRLPRLQSGLGREYYALSKRPEFQILGQFSWTQPARPNRPVLLQDPGLNGWQINGNLSVQQNQYFSLNSQFDFNLADKAQIHMQQNQRLKPDTVYYLDHPQAGMLIRIHPLA